MGDVVIVLLTVGVDMLDDVGLLADLWQMAVDIPRSMD